MIPIGYMSKKVILRPKWLKNDKVKRIYSVSSCVSEDFADYINYWKHNGYWFFNSPEDILELAKEQNIDLEGAELFYYEAYSEEYDEDEKSWNKFSKEESFLTSVVQPQNYNLEGFDIVSYSGSSTSECSPLSCNHLAEKVEVQENCLLKTFEDAQSLVQSKTLEGCEPGPYRIIAVYKKQKK